MPRNDVAIYTPTATVLYERQPEVTGGAERQTTLLAAALARAGLRVAHIVLPVSDPAPLEGSLTLVEGELVTAKRGPIARMTQLARVWSALREADAEVYVFRHSLPALGVAALFCRLRRRRLIFAALSDLDFTFGFFVGRRPELEVYRFGVRNADTVVVQTRAQAELAHRAFPDLSRVVELPSFAEQAQLRSTEPEAFLWVGRLDETKQPLRYLELAEAVPEARFWMVPRRLDPLRSGGSPSGGGADEQLEQEVYERAARLSNLELVEQRPHREAMELVDRSVAVVNTSPAEGMPNLFLEAWARGVPVLSYEFDPDGLIERERLGLVAGGSADRLARGARQMWEQRGDLRELADRVRSHLEATHGVEAVSRHWLELIADLRKA